MKNYTVFVRPRAASYYKTIDCKMPSDVGDTEKSENVHLRLGEIL